MKNGFYARCATVKRALRFVKIPFCTIFRLGQRMQH